MKHQEIEKRIKEWEESQKAKKPLKPEFLESSDSGDTKPK